MLDALTAPAAAIPIPGLSAALSLARAAEGFAELTASGRVSAETDVAGLSSRREILATAEAGQIGVDSDTELQALIQIEQAFSANVQVIQAASRMLDQLLEI
jgi:flagellar hook-associated protein 1 FlgK